jgi:hypothetical protein
VLSFGSWGTLPERLENLIDKFLNRDLLFSVSAPAMLVSSLPVILSGVYYQSAGGIKVLNRAGWIAAALASVGVLAGVIARIYLGALDQYNIFGSEKVLTNLKGACDLCLTVSFCYLGSLFGVSGSK